MTQCTIRDAQRPCAVCENATVDFLHAQRFVLPENHPLCDGYDVVACSRCGFVYADTRATQRDYDIFYAVASQYEDNKTSTGGGENWWDLERLTSTAGKIAQLLPNTSARILDIGCANGGLLRCLKDIGYANLAGCDPSKVCVENTRKLGIQGYVATIFTVSQQCRQVFDCVICSHVLEHVRDLQSAVRQMKDLLIQGGHAYVEVPDATRYCDFVASPFQDFNVEHINHFSQLALRNLMQGGDFVEEYCGCKEILAAPGKPYPAIFGFYSTGTGRGLRAREKQKGTERDDHLVRSIRKYIQRSREFMQAVEEKLERVAGQTVIVWGTGQLAMELLAETALGQAEIAAWVDGNPVNWGRTLRGVCVLSPDDLKSRQLPFSIVIATTLHQQSIVLCLREMGMTNEVICLDVDPGKDRPPCAPSASCQ